MRQPNRWGPPLKALVVMIARMANIIGVCQRTLVRWIATERARDAKEQNMSSDQLAAASNYCKRSADEMIDSVDELENDPLTLDDLLLVLIHKMVSPNFVNEGEAYTQFVKNFKELYPTIEEVPKISIVAILEEGARKGIFTKEEMPKGRWKSYKYIKTSADFEYGEPQTMEDFCGVVYRAGLVSLPTDTKTIIVDKLLLGSFGTQRFLSRVLNKSLPNPRDPNKAHGLGSIHDVAGKAIALSKENGQDQDDLTFASLMTISKHHPNMPESSPVQAIEWAKAHYPAGLAQLWTYQLPLCAAGKIFFINHWEEIVRNFKEECKIAELISGQEAKKEVYQVTLSYGDLKI